MSKYNYPKFKIIIDPDSKKTQGLRTGDVVRRQYFDNSNLVYSLMIVIDTGIDIIRDKESHYFIGGLIEGDEPQKGEMLDFVRVTNLFDRGRSGALYLTASDSESPYMDVIDGIATEHSLYLLDRTQRIISGELFEYPINGAVTYPERLIISYKIRSSNILSNVPLSIRYVNGDEIDGTDTIEVSTDWQYKLSVITIDYPAQYARKLIISPIIQEGEWCEISDLNIIRLSDIATFSNATKTRIGKITGITDPVFGVLEGYGAYFKNLYATKNVNVAGTLTAADEHGFASTFYVGKIHKNVILNSLACEFSGSHVVPEATPADIGDACQISTDARLKVQTGEWRDSHTDKKYCFSIWMKGASGNVAVYQDEHPTQNIEIDCEKEWKRYRVSFIIKPSSQSELSIWLKNIPNSLIVSSPQLEAGVTPSQYQPTDGTLSYTEDYGAWFNKGGIGGTIQNPLLRLNEDGSISSRDRSFVINTDGTGHFASGRFTWTKDTITLQDVTIKWEDLSEEAQENLSPVTLDIVSRSGLVVKNRYNDVDATAMLYRNGKELDSSGTEYIYTWKLWNASGTAVIRTYTGKSIIVSKTDITSKGTLTCEVS